MPLGEQITYTSPPIRTSDDGPVERFTARYPNIDEFIAHREAIAKLNARPTGAGPLGVEAQASPVQFMRVNYDAVLPLLTGYSVNGVQVDTDWRGLLVADARYLEVVAAIGFELFRSASIESDG